MTAEPSDEAIDDLSEAVEEFGKGVAATGATRPPTPLDARRLVSELRHAWETANHHRLGSPAEEEDEEVRPDIPILSPSEVLARWRREGAAWIRSCSRLHLRALVLAAKDTTTGPALLADGTFWPALQARLRDRQADQILNTAYFIAANAPWIQAAIRSRAAVAPADVPSWWVNPGPAPGPLAAAVARVAGTTVSAEVIDQLGLPDALPDSFLAEVARASQATSAAELAALCVFLDRGVEMGRTAAIFESTRDWVRRAIQVGVRFSPERLAVADLLRRRIGELAAGRDEARWVGLEAERRTSRGWLIGEIFRVLFTHLVPDGPSRHMTEPRRKFWSQYDHSVEKIWLLICGEHRARLDGDEAVAKLQQHGLLEVLHFKGQVEQDGLWMHLRSGRGEQVTILEGNANMAIRIRLGALGPPVVAHGARRARTVDYNQAKARLPESDGTTVITHRGDWVSRATNALRDVSVYSRGAH